MPRAKNAVKAKFSICSPGPVDLHFHGAFGIDLMRADETALDRLSKLLWQNGLAGFLATTLSSSQAELLPAVARLGEWIRRGHHPGAVPLGIHLEGPFLSPKAAGAHPPGVIRPIRLSEVLELWDASLGTIKILTVAPENQDPTELKRVLNWARRVGIRLSLGHSHATQAQAEKAFDQGFSGVTHAWNAMPFHHRSPGVLGAALGRKGLHVEVIIDGIHVDSTLVRWTRILHPKGTCFVSDCAPAAGLKAGSRCLFGPLSIELREGACHLADGTLAGGGLLLPEAYANWLKTESLATGIPVGQMLQQSLVHLCDAPLAAIGMSRHELRHRQVTWRLGANQRFKASPSKS